MNLSEHFTLIEFTRSATASKLQIDNTPSSDVITNLKRLCAMVLEPLRLWYGKPITIGSGYRCYRLNRAVGGVPNSQHRTGEACDIHLPSIEEGKKMFQYIKSNLIFDQLIWEHQGKTYWIHVSYRATKNRKHVIDNLTKK